MSFKNFYTTLILIMVLVQNTYEFRFMRRIQAIGRPYYKILMSLGSCKDKLLYFDQKIWGKITLNRVLDIYYKCDNDNYKVSRVEIKLVINNTSSFAYSEAGVGDSEFSATLYLPTNLNFIIYTLAIFTCSLDRDSDEISLSNKANPSTHLYMPFLRNDIYK